MNKIVLISCASKKLNVKAIAEELYTSPLFKLSLQFAKKIKPEGIYILSAKYGLIGLNKRIVPYNITMNNMPIKNRRTWAQEILKRLNSKFDLKKCHFIVLAGIRYREFLIPELYSCEMPLENLTIGRQLQYLKGELYSE